MSSRSFDINICKGCFSLWSDLRVGNLNCNMAPECNKRRCPCLKCILKMICKKECDDFIKYRGDIHVQYLRVKKE
jgi:hypothetical protein